MQSVTKRFTGPAGEIVALEDAQLNVAPGEFVCLIGASGCGKSTLLRIIAGFEPASAGSVQVRGKLVGSAELPTLVANSRDLHAYRAAQHRPGALLPVPHADHFTVLDELRRPGGVLLNLARALLET